MKKISVARRLSLVAVSGSASVALVLVGLGQPVNAAGIDSDGDRMPNRWELANNLNPQDPSDATRDPDRDALTNRAEYRHGGEPREEDSDDDGHDDGDEMRDGLEVDDRDSDDDGRIDGHELGDDGDRIRNEDEDDVRENCAADDDDSDSDGVSDEDENELRLNPADPDSDDDEYDDGSADFDDDGVQNEDEDDSDADNCDGDSDDDGEDDEDEADTLGTIVSFVDGTLTISTIHGGEVWGTVTDDTEIEFEDVSGGDDEASAADLEAGVEVADLEYEDDSTDLEELEIYSAR